MERGAYIPQLTVTRFVAALAVVIFHYGLQAPPFAEGWWHRLFSEGSIAVSYFFFLSGFVLALRYAEGIKKKELRKYAVARIARIYPLYLAAFLLTLFLGMWLKDFYPRGSSILAQALMLQAWWPGFPLEINYPGWSLSCEAFFYALFPLLAAGLALKKGRGWVIMVLIISWIASQCLHIALSSVWYQHENLFRQELNLYHPLMNVSGFAAGVLTGYLLAQSPNRTLPGAPWIVLSGVALLIAVLSSDNPVRPFVHNGLLAPLFALMLWALACDRSYLSVFLSRKPFVFLGEISYGIYLLQFPVWLLMGWASGMPGAYAPDWAYLLAYLLVLIACAALSFYALEQPARKWLKRKLK